MFFRSTDQISQNSAHRIYISMAAQTLQSGIRIERGNRLPCNHFSSKPNCAPISGMPFINKINDKRKPNPVLSMTRNNSSLQIEKVKKKIEEENVLRCSDPSRCASWKLEEWMHDSVLEIVRHIQEAPFLYYVYGKKSHSAKIQRLRVSEDMFGKHGSWDGIKNSLRDRGPDGIILVQRLDEDSKCRQCTVSCPESPEKERQVLDDQNCSQIWGLVVEGRGLGIHACYILKTTQVVTHIGYCTHFTLMRAKCFGPSADTQLKKLWLNGQ